ncbi:SusC/RagA family TonB-linked outer membrane protein [Parapedobacter tibetensis]|uniref:SusC/RagA family TonB-linked outer membrane protein n=1 Tax=Parapedobacter tibetensis TaxID=2972951 RepID=UPI00214DEF7E|nr:SusC/RagA family TonB-linked outer membrane protein [Parapedobacter tibetensis]
MINYDFPLFGKEKIPLGGINQLFRIMKLTSLLLLIGFLHLSAASRSQTVSLDVKNQPIGKVFEAIEKQTNLMVVYNDRFVNPSTPVSIRANGLPLTHVLASLLKPVSLTYHITENTIVITELPADKHESTSPIPIEIQQQRISGRVTDEYGSPLEGVTVTIKSTAAATTTDVNGYYRIIPSSKGDTLVFSMLGYNAVERPIGTNPTINITLTASVSDLEEVVVVGYGVRRKESLTGAVSTVDAQALENRPVSNLASALQGTTPGLTVTRSSGQPGNEGIRIQMRGATSANGNVNPLLIVDGVAAPIGTLQTLNVNDVDNISFLKDAAAAAIYGAQAAGGVILVTTKKGISGKTTFAYSNLFGADWMLNVPQRMSLLEEANFSNLSAGNAGGSPVYTDAEIQMIKDGVEYYVDPSDTNRYIYLNQQDFVSQTIRDVTAMQTHNLSASGGTEKLNFLFSFGTYSKNGAFRVGPDAYNRYNGRINIGANLSKHVSIDSRVAYTKQKVEMPSLAIPALLFQALRLRQRWPIFTPEGRLSGEGSFSANQSYAYLKEGGYNHENENNFDGVFTLRIKELVKGLQLRAIYGAQYNLANRDLFSRTVELWQRYYPVAYINQTNKFEVTRGTYNTNNLQFLADYAISLGSGHELSALAGYQFEDSRMSSVHTSSQNLASNDLPALGLGDDATKTNNQSINTYAYKSYFGRLNYSYQERYLLELTLRADESSRLAPGLRVKTFPSASAGWNIHKESWYGTSSLFSTVKLRASWGQLGSGLGNIIGNYDFMNMLSRNNNLVLGASEDRAMYFYQSVVPSSSLTWETVQTTNGGLDLGMFRDKLLLSADYYVKYNKNMLTPLQLPGTFGVGTPRTNNGELKSWGWELEANYRNTAGNGFRYSLGLNVSDNQNELMNYAGRKVIAAGIVGILEGYPLNSIWGYQTGGYLQSQEEVDNSAFFNANTGVGDIKYTDQNADDRINIGRGTVEDHGDLVYLGTDQPRYNFGVNAGFEWHRFDFSFFLQGIGKRTFYATVNTVNPQVTAPRQPLSIHLDHWSETNRDATFPRPFRGGQHNYVFSDKWMLNGQYIRLKNIQLGYSLPESLLQKVRISRVRVYFSGQDLLTITRLGIFDNLFNPEYLNNVEHQYPFSATASFGLNVTF